MLVESLRTPGRSTPIRPNAPVFLDEDDAAGIGVWGQSARTGDQVGQAFALRNEGIRTWIFDLASYDDRARKREIRLSIDEHFIIRQQHDVGRQRGPRQTGGPAIAPIRSSLEQEARVELHVDDLGQRSIAPVRRHAKDLRVGQERSVLKPAGQHREITRRHPVAVGILTRFADRARNLHPACRAELRLGEHGNLRSPSWSGRSLVGVPRESASLTLISSRVESACRRAI